MDSKQDELVAKLEGLKKYQDEQENVLKVSLFILTTNGYFGKMQNIYFKANRINQQALLTREQVQMYEMLGLSVSNYTEVSAEPVNIESENENEFEEIFEEDPDDAILSSDESFHVSNYNNELVTKDTSPIIDNELQDETEEQQIKRPFLKRGAGLQTRFRIPPDAFNLKKLPRYKYADRIKKTLGRNGQVRMKEVEKETEVPRKKEPVKKKQTSPPVKQQESTELIQPTNIAFKIPNEEILPPVSEPPIEEWFNSRVKEKQPELSETPKVAKLPKGVSWAKILNSNTLADNSVEIGQLLNLQNSNNESELDETGLFHLLEDKVNNMSLDVSMSSIMKLLATLRNSQTPLVEEGTLVSPEDPLIENIDNVNLQLEPHPAEVEQNVMIDETIDEEDDEDEVEEETVTGEHHVRFSDNIEVVEDSTNLSTDIEAIELSQTSTPNEQKKFEEFKRRILGHKTLPQERGDLKEKSDQMRAKLAELDAEIDKFREQRAIVDQQRQELELDKLQLENDREDMLEQMKDDRIKMELQLHDERLKVEQEKQRVEKMLKTPSKKEREEIAKLKETIDELREDLKAKEVRHGSTSARYRSQIKQLEKENQSLKLELDVVKKENKKLEFDNARLRKDTNSKMLQEINRNIAKLAPQDVKQPEPVKKPVARKSDPPMKKRVKSVPESSSDTSEEEFSSHKSRKSMKENNPLQVRRSEPTKTATRYEPSKPLPRASSSDVLAEMKREIVNSDGSKDIWYPNGNLKKISPDGMLIRMLYFNKDIKETNINEGTTKYYYNDTNTWHTTYIDGLEILEYPE